jgi:hypothetical protein
MRKTSIITISQGLLVAGLLPAMLSAQIARPAQHELKANHVRVDTHMLVHQRPADTETLDEHPTVARSTDAPPATERKHPGGAGHGYLTNSAGNNASATTVAMEGSTSWSVTNSVLNLKVAKVTHDGPGTTGSLRLRLWATASAYHGGTITGYVMGTYQFQSQLGPNQYYHDVNVNVPFTAPPDGNYYTTLSLEEYLGSGWYIMSYVTYDSTSHFGGGSQGDSQLSLQGNASWQITDSVLTLKVDKVVNDGAGSSGSLRLRLWATEAAYGGGTIRGYVLGAYQFSRPLEAHEYFYAISQQVQFTRPPDGTYHTTLTLEEYTSTGWVIRDYLGFNSTTTFGNPNNNGGGDPCAYRAINTYGQPVGGALTSGNCLNGGFRVDGYEFFAVAGMQIQIVMQSPDFYTYQVLFGPNGDYLGSAQEGWSDGQTVVTITAPETGSYHLLATSNDPSTGGPGAGGQYTVSVRVF